MPADSSSAAALIAGDQPALLASAIDHYRELVASGGWPAYPDGPELLSGMRHEQVRQLRRQLRMTGDFNAEVNADPLLFDVQLTAALMRYQARHGLDTTGIVDRLTRQSLNVSASLRLEELLAAQQDWQRMGATASSRRLWVNIPEATVSAINGARIELNLHAIVGKPSRQTPAIDSQIRRIIVNPSWTVPRSIAVNDLLPRQQADPAFLERNRIRVLSGWGSDEREVAPADVAWQTLSAANFPYRLRQEPGLQNALGAYKFDFPNPYDVYLHDTPVISLLDLSYRSFSSGCVRVDDAPELARWLLNGSAADLAPADRSVSRTIELPQPVPVELVYLTAWVAPVDGTVQFRHDIYGQLPTMEPQSLAGIVAE